MTDWQQIPGFGSRFEASRDGTIRRCGGDELRAYMRGGYPCVTLRVDGKRTMRAVHHLVLEAFVGVRPTGMQGAHLDGDRLNAAADNLAWVTPAENEAHKRAHRTSMDGERSPHARFSNEQAVIIREIVGAGISQRKVSTLTGVSENAISNIIKGATYHR